MPLDEALINDQVAKGVPADRAKDGLVYIKRVLEQCTEDDWVAFVANGEPPPIKLGAAQMEALRGGEICVVGGALAYSIITLWGVSLVAYAIKSAE